MKTLTGITIFGHSQHDTYEVLSERGRGHFGVVYEAKRQSDGQLYAVKTFQRLDADSQRSLSNEGRLAAGIRHTNVVRIFHFHDGTHYPDLPPYMIMELISGGNFEDVLESRGRNKRFTSEELADIYLQLALGMQAISQHGLIHRDIKPDNILVDHNGVLKIADFGLSKIVDAATRSETFKGTGARPYYAPEAWRHEKNTVTMDIYSMGIVFYRAATLQYPYDFGRNPDWQEVHLYSRAKDPLKLNPSLDPFFVQMIMRMMAKSPADRYQSWDEIVQNLRERQRRSTSLSHSEFTSLLQRDVETHRQQEAEALAVARQTRQQEETQRLIEYAVTDIREIVKLYVEEFNAQSQLTKLELVETDSISFIVQKRGAQNDRKIIFTIKPADILPQMQPLMHFNSIQVKAFGVIQSPSGYGFNLILASHRPDDLHGQWHVAYKSQVFPYLNMQQSQMTPYSMEELPSRSLRSGFNQPQFNANLLVPIIHDLLAE